MHAKSFDDLTRANKDKIRAVATTLERLDKNARLMLALIFIEGLNEAEAAAVLDRSVEEVRVLAGAAQRALAISVAADTRHAA